MKDNILITGHKGFIGKALCDKLRKIFDVDEFRIITTEGVDLRDINMVKALPKASFIVHLAAKTFVPESFLKPDDYYYNNVVCTLNILEKARNEGSKVIFLSTYIYGPPKYLPIDESHPAQPMNPYTQSKVICEQLCAAYSRDFSVSIVVLRSFNIYGPGQSALFFIPTILDQLSKSKIQLQDSKPKRDYIFIDDLIDLISLVIRKDFKGYEVYNVGSSISYSVKEIVSMILQLSKSDLEVAYTDISRKGEVNDCIASIDKASADYGWKPSTSLKEGLLKTIEWHKKVI